MDKIIVIFFVLALVGCKKPSEVIAMKDVNSNWNKKQNLTFEFNIKDSQNPKNIIFVVRNNNQYPYSNLWLITTINKDKNILKKDTLNFILAEPNGNWIGTGFGETKEILFFYKTNFLFPQNGHYKISVEQAMRKNPLPGIEDFGIKLQNTKP